MWQTFRYANEEVRSNYTYPNEYNGPKPIANQIRVIAKTFSLDPSQAFEFAKQLPALESFVPANALKWTGWWATPSVDAVAARFFPGVIDPAYKHCRAIRLVLQKIANSRRLFCNYCEYRITPDHLEGDARTAHALASIAERQKGDILIIAAQLGMYHRAMSANQAHESFAPNEFGLGSFTGGSIILTHPERISSWKELSMGCSGEKFAPTANGKFSRTLVFEGLLGNGVDFGDISLKDDRAGCGYASGFLPDEALA